MLCFQISYILNIANDTNLEFQVNELHSGAIIVRTLSEGASAIVYEVKLKEGARAFIKYYFKSDFDSITYFQNEFAVISKLCQHPTVSLYVPHVLALNQNMLLMSPIAKELGINQLQKKYFIQLVNIFRIIHQDLGIIHRDVQPDNILLNDVTDSIFIIDWACSTEIRTTTPYDGTIFYAAQELIPLVFTDVQYKPKSAHDLESIIKLLYHAVNQEKVDQYDVDVCQLTDVIAYWDEALKDAPWPSYLNVARQEKYEAMIEIIEQCFSTE